MKTLLTTGLLCTAIGASVGWWNASEYCKNKAQKLEIATLKAEQERNEAIEGAINGYYELYKNAVDSEPVVVTKRLYIKADCSAVQATKNTSVDDGADTARVEIDSRVVRSITAVAEKHKKEYEKCAVTLRAFQSLIELQ